MTRTVHKLTRSTNCYIFPGLWAEQEAVGPFRVVRIEVFCDAKGNGIETVIDTVAENLTMFEAFDIRSETTGFRTARTFGHTAIVDATDRTVCYADFALLHMGREKFDAYVNS